jgi:hypothetical protein
VKINVNGSDYILIGTVPFSGSDSTLRILDVYFDGTNFYQKIPNATTSVAGITKLNSSTSSTSEIEAATPKAVKDAKDLSLLKAQNLNDLADKPTARTNLDVYSKSEVDSAISTSNPTSVGALGTYAFLKYLPATVKYPGDTANGSDLAYSNCHADSYTSPSGVWRCMGYSGSAAEATSDVTLWLRIS